MSFATRRACMFDIKFVIVIVIVCLDLGLRSGRDSYGDLFVDRFWPPCLLGFGPQLVEPEVPGAVSDCY